MKHSIAHPNMSRRGLRRWRATSGRARAGPGSAEQGFQPVGPAFTPGWMARAALLQGVFQLAQQLALVLGELDRRLHGDVAVQVAGVAGAHAFDALAAQAE